MKAVVLAAGRGVRLEPLTQGRPKHLLPVAGAPLIVHCLKAIRSAGIGEVLIVVHHMKEQIVSCLGDGSSLGLHLEYADQGGVLGTGDALRVAKDFVGNTPFVLVYGDLAFAPDSITRAVALYRDDMPGVVAGVELEDVGEYGAMEVDGDRLIRITEKPKNAGSGTINSGIYVFSPEILRYVGEMKKSERGELELPDAINISSGSGERFRVLRLLPSEWVDVGRPWNLLDANRMFMDKCLNESRIEGSVDDGARLNGNVVVEGGARVLPGVYVEGPAWISSGCVVGPNCYIRPYTYLCKGARVGNACEVKGSIIMEDSHVGHLSYVGDSVLGARCNLGAGTITANLRFDDKPVMLSVKEKRVTSGRRKLGAFLGDEVKTGINVSIYPGVKVGRGSWIAPHASLDRDVPPMTLVTSEADLSFRPRR